MRVSQLIHAMDKDEKIIINDESKPINRMELYVGSVRGIKRDDPINELHVNSVFACDNIMVVLVGGKEDPMKEQIEEMARDLDAIFSTDFKGDYESGLMDFTQSLYNAGSRKQEWISVDERLPSEDEIRDEYGELVPFLVVEKDTTYPYRAFYDRTIWGDGLMKIRGITHWMPLPEPPEAGDEDD